MQIGDTESKEDIMAGWKLIAKGDPAEVEVTRLETIMEKHDVEYLKQTGKASDKLAYAPW